MYEFINKFILHGCKYYFDNNCDFIRILLYVWICLKCKLLYNRLNIVESRQVADIYKWRDEKITENKGDLHVNSFKMMTRIHDDLRKIERLMCNNRSIEGNSTRYVRC